MNSKTLRRFSVCLPLMVLAACSEPETASTDGGKEVVTFNVTADGVAPLQATRTQVGSIDGDGVLSIEWSAGDRIGVFGSTTQNVQFKSTNTEPAARASFQGSMTSGDTPVYAYYPYSEDAASLSAIPVEIPAEQIYADENSVAQYDVKASDNIMLQDDGTYGVRMRQMAALLRFEINLTDVAGIEPDEQLLTATIQTATTIAGQFTYDLSRLDDGFTVASGGYGTDALTIYFENRPVVGETVVAYAVVAPGAHKGTEWYCNFETDKHTVTFTTEALSDFEAGKYYTVPLNAEVIAEKHAVIDSVEEMEETANCYIVTETGAHDFLATVIGNGQKGIIPGAGFHTESASINPQSAKLLWQDVDGFVSDVTLQEGRVHYQVNSLSGNAVIAVYSGPDQTGDILWSWHIWGTGGEMPADEEYTNLIGAKFVVMDRTLGAHSKTSSTATLYQWGRKDPFPNAEAYYVDGQRIDILESMPSYYHSDATTILDGVRRPSELMQYYVTDNFENDWLSVSNDNLWGDAYVENGSDRLNDVGTPVCGAGWVYGKTIYDPSPVGYRVAGKYTWTGFLKDNTYHTADNSSAASSAKLDQINYVKYDNGYYFKKDDSDVEGAYYPMTGRRCPPTCSLFSGGNESSVGLTANYWSSTPTSVNSGAGQSHCLDMTKYVYPITSTRPNSNNQVRAAGFIGRKNANAVRCVRE